MDVLRHHWYDLGIPSAIAAIVYFNNNRRSLSTTQKRLIASFLAVLVHQFEEYGFPGGFSAAMNTGVQASAQPDRYPLNAHSAMITNTLAIYGLYLPPLFFPNYIWFALEPIFLGFGQIIIHGVNINSSMHSYYNPGLATAILVHLPLGIAYMRQVYSTGLLTLLQLGLGLAYDMAIGFTLLGNYTFTWAPDMDSPYPFTPAEMQRGGVAAWLAQH